MRRHILIALAVLVTFPACDSGRIERLEKENADLKASVARTSAATDFNLQEKCSNAAKSWARENFPGDKHTIFLDETNHYNRKMNKCFVVIEHHEGSEHPGFWYNYISLWDVFENTKYGEFNEAHLVDSHDPNANPKVQVYGCEVYGTKCKSLDEFNNLTRSYLND
jgi:hypothetical protein